MTDVRQRGLIAARSAISALRSNRPIGTQTLLDLERALEPGEDERGFLDNRPKSALYPSCPSRAQRKKAIAFLEDLIDDLQIEMEAEERTANVKLDGERGGDPARQPE